MPKTFAVHLNRFSIHPARGNFLNAHNTYIRECVLRSFVLRQLDARCTLRGMHLGLLVRRVCYYLLKALAQVDPSRPHSMRLRRFLLCHTFPHHMHARIESMRTSGFLSVYVSFWGFSICPLWHRPFFAVSQTLIRRRRNKFGLILIRLSFVLSWFGLVRVFSKKLRNSINASMSLSKRMGRRGVCVCLCSIQEFADPC